MGDLIHSLRCMLAVRLIAAWIVAALSGGGRTTSPSPWILIARFPDISVYIDSTRIERARPDTSVGVWLGWISDTPMRTDSTPKAGFVKKIIVHAGIRCPEGRARALAVDVYDLSATRVGHREFTATDDLHPTYDQMVVNVLPAACLWLRDPTKLPLVVPRH
jgi:hypothetical protein